MPFKSIVVETDGNGKIIGTLQNEKGPVSSIDLAYKNPSLSDLFYI